MKIHVFLLALKKKKVFHRSLFSSCLSSLQLHWLPPPSSSFWYSVRVAARPQPWPAHSNSQSERSDLQLILCQTRFLMPHWRRQQGISWAQHMHGLILAACLPAHVHTVTSLSWVSTKELTPLFLFSGSLLLAENSLTSPYLFLLASFPPRLSVLPTSPPPHSLV